MMPFAAMRLRHGAVSGDPLFAYRTLTLNFADPTTPLVDRSPKNRTLTTYGSPTFNTDGINTNGVNQFADTPYISEDQLGNGLLSVEFAGLVVNNTSPEQYVLVHRNDSIGGTLPYWIFRVLGGRFQFKAVDNLNVVVCFAETKAGVLASGTPQNIIWRRDYDGFGVRTPFQEIWVDGVDQTEPSTMVNTAMNTGSLDELTLFDQGGYVAGAPFGGKCKGVRITVGATQPGGNVTYPFVY